MFNGPLDLSDADTSGFDPIPAATYKCEIVNAKWEKTGPNGKMGADVPQLNVQFRVIDNEQYENRRVFNRYTPAPPADYDSDASKRMKGMFVNFLVALGYDKDEIMGGNFNLDIDDLVSRECFVTVGIRPAKDGYEAQNQVRGVKSLSDGMATASSGGSGLL
jgi:hypothetical protein